MDVAIVGVGLHPFGRFGDRTGIEMGAMAALSGALPRAIETPDGILTPAQVEKAIQPRAGYRTPTSLVVLENSHNLAGGRVTAPGRMAELIAVARRHGLPVHLDGARILNAAAALGITAADLSAGCDTVMFCLSKGLGAPVGSVIAGDGVTADALATAVFVLGPDEGMKLVEKYDGIEAVIIDAKNKVHISTGLDHLLRPLRRPTP